MSDYKTFKPGSLKVKGKPLFKADKNKSKKSKKTVVVDADKEKHGGWRRIPDETDVRGGIEVSFEVACEEHRYLAAMDNGRFTIGPPHTSADPKPAPEEVFALIKTPDDTKFSLKTGYGKYIGVDASGYLVATADAIGPRERFDAVFQEGLCAVQSVSSGLFLTMQTNDEDVVMACSKTANVNEMVNIRTREDQVAVNDYTPVEDKTAAGVCETTYQKMFQHSKVETKNRMISFDRHNKTDVRQAQREGNLHEVLLDRRRKLKSDKYC